MIELTPEQRDELRTAGDVPIRFADPESRAEYVVVTASLFERMQRVYEEMDPSFYEFEDIEPRP